MSTFNSIGSIDFIGPIGFIGLGEMGGRMARVLSSSVERLLVYDIQPIAAQQLESHGASVATDLSALAEQCETIFLCLPDETAVDVVLYGEKGLAKSNTGRIKTIIDCSTLDVDTVRTLATNLKSQQNIEYCDCPVSGLPARAESGELTIMFGGQRTCFNQAMPLLSIMGKQVVYCGNAGSGQMMKAVNNIVYNININAICEMMPLATRGGLDLQALETVLINGSSRSFASEHFIPRILDRQFENDFSMDSAHKDLLNINKLKNQFDAETPLFDAMQNRYEKTQNAGYGDEPKSALIKLYEQTLNVLVKR